MPSTRKRGKGYGFVVDLPKHPDGRRNQVTQDGFKTEKAAYKAGLKIEELIEKGEYIADNDLTIAQFIPEYIKWFTKQGILKPNTIYNNTNILNRLVDYIGTIKVQDYSLRHHEKFMLSRIDKGDGDGYLKVYQSIISGLFTRAIDLKMIEKNPVKGYKIPKQQKTITEIENENNLPKYFEREELTRLLNAAQKRYPKYYMYFRLMSHGGLRPGEAQCIEISDFSFAENTIKITKTLVHSKLKTHDPDQYLCTPKTAFSVREIEMDIETMQLAREHIIQHCQKQKYPQNIFRKKQFLFAGKTGDPLSGNEIYRVFKRCLALAGLSKHYHLHYLRHTNISLMAAAGVSLDDIYARVGHGDDKITRDIYLHITKERAHNAAEIFSSYLKSL